MQHSDSWSSCQRLRLETRRKVGSGARPLLGDWSRASDVGDRNPKKETHTCDRESVGRQWLDCTKSALSLNEGPKRQQISVPLPKIRRCFINEGATDESKEKLETQESKPGAHCGREISKVLPRRRAALHEDITFTLNGKCLVNDLSSRADPTNRSFSGRSTTGTSRVGWRRDVSPIGD